MIKVFKYELRRMLFNKFFIGLLVISALYGYKIMDEDIVFSMTKLAPFSPWSYGRYLSNLLPILFIALLFFISFLYSKQEKSVQVLTKATPIDELSFRLLRYGAVATAFILISSVPIGVSLWFYAVNFHFTQFQSFIFPTIITLLPSSVFIFGLGVFVGQFSSVAAFVFMPIILLLAYIPMPYALDLLCSNFFSGYPNSLKALEPNFCLPLSVLVGRCIYFIFGFLLIIASAVNKKNYQ